MLSGIRKPPPASTIILVAGWFPRSTIRRILRFTPIADNVFKLTLFGSKGGGI